MRKKWKGTARRCISILTSAIMILSLAAANGMAMTAYAEEADTLMESSQELAEGEISEGEISDPGGVTQPENEDESGEAEAPADEDLIAEQPQFLAANSSISAKPYYEYPTPGIASPASADGSIGAVSYTYSDIPLRGASNSWFLYNGTEQVQYEAVFFEPSGISDYGTVVFADTAPYITYTPSGEAANQTVKFKVKATAGSDSVTGDFFWTVNVGEVPNPNASKDASLSGLTYQIGNGAPVSIPLEDGKLDYEISLADADYNKEITLSGKTTDSGAAVVLGQTIKASYWPQQANLTVTAADKATTQKYTVEFSIPQKDCPAGISVGGVTCWDGDTVLKNPVYVTPDKRHQLLLDCGGGTTGYGSYSIVTGVGEIGNQYGINDYPNRYAALGFTLSEGEQFTATVNFYKEHVTPSQTTGWTPVKTVEITVIAKDFMPVADVALGGATTTFGIGAGMAYGTESEALRAAWDYAAANSSADAPAVITLLQSVELDGDTLEAPAGSSIIFDGGTNTLSGNQYTLIQASGGNFTLAGGTIRARGCIMVRENGTANINGGEIICSYTGAGGSNMHWAIWAADGEVQISGGEITGDTCIYAMGKSNITISGGTINGGVGSVISAGIWNDGAAVTVTGGTVSGQCGINSVSGSVTVGGSAEVIGTERGVAIYQDDAKNPAVLTVNGGEITSGNYGILAQCCTVDISGGTVSGKYGVYAWTDANIQVSGGKISGTTSPGLYVYEGSAVVTGGEFYGKYGVSLSKGSAALSGGTFTGDTASVRNGLSGRVADLLDKGCAYFNGTAVNNETKIIDGDILNGEELTADGGYGTVTVSAIPLEIIGQPQGKSLNYGDAGGVELSVLIKTADDSAEVRCQWYRDGEAIPGANEASYSLPTGLNVGKYKYYCVAACGEYSLTSDAAEIIVAPKAITVTADKQTKVYGDSEPELTYQADGLVNGDALNGITVVREQGENVGEYVITVSQSTGTNPNYNITFVPGKMTIKAINIGDARIELGDALVANGKLQTQSIERVTVVKADGKEVEVTYTVAGNQGTEPGTYVMTITGIGNFTGSVQKAFVIAPGVDNNLEVNENGDVVFGEGIIGLQVQRKAGAPEAEIKLDKAAIIAALIRNGDLTEEELVQVANGADIYVVLEIMAANITPESKAQIENTVQGYTIGQYMDISLFKQIVSNGKPGEMMPLKGTYENIQVRIKVPENLLNHDSSVIRTFWVVRNHDGVVEFLPTTFDAQTNTLTFETNKFSDYAIVYKDAKKAAEEASKPSNTANGTTPQTGDSVSLLPWFVLMLASFAVAAVSGILIRRKRAK